MRILTLAYSSLTALYRNRGCAVNNVQSEKPITEFSVRQAIRPLRVFKFLQLTRQLSGIGPYLYRALLPGGKKAGMGLLLQDRITD